MSNEIVEILLTAGLATQDSARNLNRDIKNLEKNNIGKLNLNVGISKESIANLKNQIDAIHKSLPNLNVSLNVNASNISSANGFISQLDKQTSALVSKLDEVIDRMGRVNSGGRKPSGSGSNPFSPTQEGAEKTLKSIIELEDHVRKSNGKIKIIDDKETGKVKEVVTTIKNQLGQLETKVYRPKIEIAVGDIGKVTKGLQESTQITNSDVFNNFNKQLEQAKNKLAELGRQGKLSGKNFKDFNKELNSPNLTTTEQLDNLINKMKQVGQVDSHNAKWKNATNSIKTQANESIASLEKLKQQASNLGLDTKQFDVMIAKMRSMSNIQITNDAQIEKANQAFSKLSSRLSELKNNTNTFSTSFNTLNTILDTVSRSGLIAESTLNGIRTKIQLLNASDLTMDEKVRRLKNEIVRLNEELGSTKHTNKMTEGMQKARNEVAKLEAQLLKTINSYKRTVNMDLANSIGGKLNGMKNIPQFENTTQTKKYMADLKAIEIQIRNLNAQATTGARNSMSVIDSFKVAMEKFPIWMLSSTIFFGAIRTGKEFIDILVDIDTKLVNISKVMSDDMNIEKVFDDASTSAETFAQSISSVLDAYGEFARQGYKGQDIQLMGESALVAGNVAEVTPEKAAEFLTSATIQWGKSASDSMSMVDAWNNISNNYATTLVKLADGHTRVASVASAMNLDFHELNAMIGTITATTKQSGTEIGNSLKALLPRLTQDAGKGALASLGIALTDADGSMRNVIDIYSEVAEKIKGLNEIEKSNVIFGLGGTYHRQRLQVFLDDLGKTDSMYRSMYKTSVDSAGSAMIENEKYMGSLQARINLMKVEFEKLAVATGEAFVSSGMIEFMKIASTFLQTMTRMVDSVGMLPIIFATASMAVLTFSNRAQTLTGALTAKVKALYAAQTATLRYNQSTIQSIASVNRLTQTTSASAVASRQLTMSNTAVTKSSAQMSNQLNLTRNSINATRTAMTMLSTAAKTVGSAMLWTVPFVALGFLIEKLTSASAKTRELKEAAVSANKEMMTSFKSNQDELTSLSAKYAELENVINSGNYDNETLAEYYDVQDKIAGLMPSLITGESSYGTKLVETSDVIKTKLGMLKEQLELEQEIASWQAKQDRDNRIKGNVELANDNLKAAEEELKNIQRRLEFIHSSGGNIDLKLSIPKLKDMDDLTNYLEKIGNQRKIAEQNGDKKAIDYYDKLAKAIMESQQSLNGFSLSYKNTQNALKLDYISKINDTLKDNEDYWGSSTTAISGFMSELLKLSDIESIESLNNALSSISINGSAGQEIYDLTKSFEELKSASQENFSEIASNIEKTMSTIETALKSSGLSDNEISSVMTTLATKLNIAKTEFAQIEAEMKRGAGTWEEAKANIAMLGEATEGMTESADDAVKSLEDLTSSVSYINGVLEDYAESNQLSTSTMMELIDKYPELIAHINNEGEMIKALEKIRDEDVNAAKQQLADKIDMSEDYYNANLKMIEAYFSEHFKFYKGDLAQFKTLAQAKADVENELINALTKQWGVYYSSITNDFMPDLKEWSTPNSSFALPGVNVEVSKETQDAIDRMKGANTELEEARNKLQNFTLDRVDLDFSKIGTSLDKTTKSAKESSKAQKESVYLSDKFKQSLEAVNLEIEKQQSLQSKHPKHSEAYRKSLEAQLKLENEKLRLIQEQSAALDKQIKAGKIAQTGSVTIGDGNSKSTTSKSKKLSGWEGRITDTYGTYRAIRNGRMHTGVDLAGATGTRLDSNVAGKVTQTGKNALSGNFVKIKDDKGLTHFYGHLDKIIAKVGDIVEAGSHIGNIGNTGNSSGSHLHYQINKANGNSFDPMEYVKAAKGMVVSSQQISSVVSNTTQSIDDAKSTLVGLQGDALSQIQKIAELEKAIIESQLASFDFKRSGYDEIIGFEQAKLKNVTIGTTQYNKTMEKQSTLLKAKQKVNNDELAYVEGLVKTGNLSAITLEEMKARTLELKTAMQLLNSEIGNLALDKIIDTHGAYTEKQDDVIAYEKNKIEELDKNSARYGATLEKLNTHMNRKIITHQDTIKSIENEIKVLGLQGEALKRAKDEIQNLTLEMQSFKQEMSDNNYEIIVNIKTRYDEEIDDVQFEIDRSKAIQALYKEGSADASNEIQKQIAWSEKLVEAHDKSRKALQAELNSRDILPERIKEVTELMEDETVAYWNAKRAVEELNESLEETRKKLLNDIADKFISALKNIYEEQRDMALDAIDDEMEAHEDAHEKRIKQLNEEMDLFRKNVEEKLRLLDRQDAERSYNMEIDEMETERDKIVDNINLLSLDDSHEAKSKKKKLLEQLDKLDKDIAEKRYQRDLELQKQGLNDLLEDKEEEVTIVEESYEKQSQATLDTLREQREYWDQYYNDLLNDERKFAQIREDILNGHFDKVVNEFQAHMAEMIATMPQLANTMNGTMEAVGTAIRQNVIDEIQRAIDALREFQDMQVATNLHVDDFNPNTSKDMTYQGNTGSKPSNTTPSSPSTNNNSNSNDSSNKGQVYASLNKGDLQVLLGKFINDAVAPDFKAETKERIALKAEGERIAGLGRANSSQIPVNSAFGNEMGKLTSSQIEQLKSFIKSNSGSILGGNYTSAFNKNLASLHTGGMTKYNGTGNDGIGGKLAMLHPNEIVLNPLQSDEMLKSSSILQNIMKMITPVISKFPTPSSIMNNSSSKGDLIINIDNVHNTNDRDAQHFVNQIGDALRTKGMW